MWVRGKLRIRRMIVRHFAQTDVLLVRVNDQSRLALLPEFAALVVDAGVAA